MPARLFLSNFDDGLMLVFILSINSTTKNRWRSNSYYAKRPNGKLISIFTKVQQGLKTDEEHSEPSKELIQHACHVEMAPVKPPYLSLKHTLGLFSYLGLDTVKNLAHFPTVPWTTLRKRSRKRPHPLQNCCSPLARDTSQITQVGAWVLSGQRRDFLSSRLSGPMLWRRRRYRIQVP